MSEPTNIEIKEDQPTGLVNFKTTQIKKQKRGLKWLPKKKLLVMWKGKKITKKVATSKKVIMEEATELEKVVSDCLGQERDNHPDGLEGDYQANDCEA